MAVCGCLSNSCHHKIFRYRENGELVTFCGIKDHKIIHSRLITKIQADSITNPWNFLRTCGRLDSKCICATSNTDEHIDSGSNSIMNITDALAAAQYSVNTNPVAAGRWAWLVVVHQAAVLCLLSSL